MLRTALGPAIAAFLEDPAIVEVMLNPDGRLWIDRLSSGLADTGERLSAADGERIVRLVAHHVGAEVHAGAPRVSAELVGVAQPGRALPSAPQGRLWTPILGPFLWRRLKTSTLDVDYSWTPIMADFSTPIDNDPHPALAVARGLGERKAG